jgi:hypothetical protein
MLSSFLGYIYIYIIHIRYLLYYSIVNVNFVPLILNCVFSVIVKLPLERLVFIVLILVLLVEIFVVLFVIFAVF